jgi:hypothetical protein
MTEYSQLLLPAPLVLCAGLYVQLIIFEAFFIAFDSLTLFCKLMLFLGCGISV